MSSVHTERRQIKLPGDRSILNITPMIREIVTRSGIKEGQVIIQTMHTTAALGMQEYEEGLQGDILKALDRLAPGHENYDHYDVEEGRENAQAHIKALFLNPSLLLIIQGGQVVLGPYQSIFFFDFDPEGRPFRTLIIQVCGEK